MRHSFRFPLTIQYAVRHHVASAIADTSPERFSQEHAYTIALISRLQGLVYDGPHGIVDFKVTSVDDRGRGAAESWSGIDFVFTASISDNVNSIEKAIIFQAKKGNLEQLTFGEKERLRGQIENMKIYTRSPKLLETPNIALGKQSPTVVSANRFLWGESYIQMSLENYFVCRLLPTLDGDTRPLFVGSVQNSSLTRLHIRAEIDNGKIDSN